MSRTSLPSVLTMTISLLLSLALPVSSSSSSSSEERLSSSSLLMTTLAPRPAGAVRSAVAAGAAAVAAFLALGWASPATSGGASAELACIGAGQDVSVGRTHPDWARVGQHRHAKALATTEGPPAPCSVSSSAHHVSKHLTSRELVRQALCVTHDGHASSASVAQAHSRRAT